MCNLNSFSISALLRKIQFFVQSTMLYFVLHQIVLCLLYIKCEPFSFPLKIWNLSSNINDAEPKFILCVISLITLNSFVLRLNVDNFWDVPQIYKMLLLVSTDALHRQPMEDLGRSINLIHVSLLILYLSMDFEVNQSVMEVQALFVLAEPTRKLPLICHNGRVQGKLL